MLKPIFLLQLQGVSKKTPFCDSFTDKNFAIFFTDIGRTPSSPLYGHLPKNLSLKRAKMVFFAQIHLFFRSKKGFRIWGVPLSPTLRQHFWLKRSYGFGGTPPPPLRTKSAN